MHAHVCLCVCTRTREKGGQGRGGGKKGREARLAQRRSKVRGQKEAVDMKKDAACPLGEDAGARGSCGVFTPCQPGEESDNLDRSL